MSQAHSYTVSMSNQTIAADATLAIIRAATALSSRASILRILRVEVSQIGTETADQLGIILGLKASAFGTYTSTTPQPKIMGGVASGITGSTSGAAAGAGTDASAEGGGAVTVIRQQGFDNRAGFLWVPTPDDRIIINLDLAFIVKMVGTPATLTGWCCDVDFEEVN